MNDVLRIVRQDAIVELTLNRPACRNALSRELIERLSGAVASAIADADVRCLILTGEPPAFCAGLDLRELDEAPAETSVHDTSELLRLCERIDRCPKPVVAAVNGPAVAGGAALVTVCDVVICAESARIGYPGVRHGLVAPLVMPYLLRAVGERRARFLLLTGEAVTAAQAVEWGLADEAVSDPSPLPRARHYARLLASHPTEATGRTKNLLAQLRRGGGPDAGSEGRPSDIVVPLTDDARTGVRRFLEQGRGTDCRPTL